MGMRCYIVWGKPKIILLEVIMKRKVLCIALALLMCMMVTVPAFADAEKETPPERGAVDISFSLKHNSGLSYKMRATITNLAEENIIVSLILYDASYNYITSCSTTSSSTIFTIWKNVTLLPGTYHLVLYYEADTSSGSYERTYHL